MPLIKSKSNKAFKENVKKEVGAGKPVKQAVAIAYSEKRNAKRSTSDGYMPTKVRASGSTANLIKARKGVMDMETKVRNVHKNIKAHDEEITK